MKKYLNRIISSVVLLVLTLLIAVFVSNALLRQSNSVAIQAVEQTTQTPTQCLIVHSPAESEITVNEPIINFSGISSVDLPLVINDVSVELHSDGSFSYDYPLNPGANTVIVTNTVETHTYTVTYNFQVISSVSPAESIRVQGETTLEISAQALKNSKVYAKINGTVVSMTSSDNGEQFISYYGTYTIPSASSKDISLGKITFYAEYNGYTDSKSGGSITINSYKASDIIIEKGQGVVIEPEITGDDVVNVLSPSVDHGRGNAQICLITSSYAETSPAAAADAKSDPDFTPELKGTIDYITDTAAYKNKDGVLEDYYILLSGRKVEQKDAKSMDGYVMPTNTVSTYKSYESDGHSNIILTMNWKVPFTAKLMNQSYYRGYMGRVFNVSSFTASYIDFVFSYTNAAQGSFDFSQSSVVRSAEWVNIGTDGTTTLRVHLKNAGKYYGYKTYFSNDNRLVISFNEKPVGAVGSHVVLDPGHGGRDCGAIAVNGTYESLINLRIAAMVKSNLEAAGVKVTILRTDDTYYSIDERQSMARSKGGNVFVSIHSNSSSSPSLSGIEAYYYRANGQPLAASIHSQMTNVWKSVYSDNTAMQNKVVASDGGVRYYPFHVTRIEECPAVLIECGYLSNSVECEKLCQNSVQTALARAIADGIINYLNAQ